MNYKFTPNNSYRFKCKICGEEFVDATSVDIYCKDLCHKCRKKYHMQLYPRPRFKVVYRGREEDKND